MQFTYSALAVMALSGLAAAQIPACATQCLADAAAKGAPSCGSDVACQCEPANKAAIQALATPCVIGACPSSELQAVLAGAAALCAGAGSSSSAASVAPSSAASVAPSSAAAVAPSSSAATYPTSSAPVYSASATPTLTTSATKASSTAASNGTAATSTPVPFTGAASQIAAGLGSVVAIGFALLAAF